MDCCIDPAFLIPKHLGNSSRCFSFGIECVLPNLDPMSEILRYACHLFFALFRALMLA